jgi:hypothetical protein
VKASVSKCALFVKDANGLRARIQVGASIGTL